MIINGVENPKYYPKPSNRALGGALASGDDWIFAHGGAFGIRKNPKMRNQVLDTLMAHPHALNAEAVAKVTVPPEAVRAISATKYVRIVSDRAGDFYIQQFDCSDGNSIWLNREFLAQVLANIPKDITLVSNYDGKAVYFIHADYGTVAVLCPVQVKQ